MARARDQLSRLFLNRRSNLPGQQHGRPDDRDEALPAPQLPAFGDSRAAMQAELKHMSIGLHDLSGQRPGLKRK